MNFCFGRFFTVVQDSNETALLQAQATSDVQALLVFSELRFKFARAY